MGDILGVKEYGIEGGRPINLKKLEYLGKGEEIYRKAREVLVRGCNDIFVEYKGGILLVVRDGTPAKGELWPIGGGIERGVPLIKSIKKKVWEECGLKLKHIKFLGIARHFWNSGPKGGSKGADELSLAYFARGIGRLKLDNKHKKPVIVTPKKYTKLKKSLHPWVRDFMDKAILRVGKR